jgi:hypothetical protein
MGFLSYAMIGAVGASMLGNEYAVFILIGIVGLFSVMSSWFNVKATAGLIESKIDDEGSVSYVLLSYLVLLNAYVVIWNEYPIVAAAFALYLLERTVLGVISVLYLMDIIDFKDSE